MPSHKLQSYNETRNLLCDIRCNVRVDTVGAIRAAVMWNEIYVPAEQGPTLPVDRSWDLSKGASSQDWKYVDFQWDNHFASLLMALDNSTAARNFAICNFIQASVPRSEAVLWL